MMTLNEAIAHANWVANNCEGECSEEHRQLAEWLRELQMLRAENASLRKELEAEHVLAETLGHCHELAQAESDRLRKLLQGTVDVQLEDCGDCWGGLCEDCGCWVAEWEKDLRALGIEVES